MIRRLTTLCLLLPILGLAACGGPPTDRLHPLLDGSHAPDVLTENRPIAKPPATDGNRFLQGWWRVRRQGPIRLLPLARGARIEAPNRCRSLCRPTCPSADFLSPSTTRKAPMSWSTTPSFAPPCHPER
jgi:hypothetical protein